MKLFTLFSLWIFVFVGVAAGEPYTIIYHRSSSYLVEGKPVYNGATFRQIDLIVEDDRAVTEEDEQVVGELKISPASFVYHDENDKRIEVVDGKDAEGGDATTFPMRFSYGSQESVEFSPSIVFRRYAAEERNTGIPNKAFTWSLGSTKEELGKFPDFLTTEEQLQSSLPYVELTDSSVKMTSALPDKTPITMSYDGRFRVEVQGTGRLARTAWTDFAADSEINAEYLFSAFPNGDSTISIDGDEIRLIIIDFQPDLFNYSGNYPITARYRWEFYVAKPNDLSVSMSSDISLETGITRIDSNFAQFAEGYNHGDRNWLFPFDVEEKSIFTLWDWGYAGTQYSYVDLKAYKPGETNFTLLYQDNDENWYYTSPKKVTVTGKTLNVTTTPPPSEDDFTSNGKIVRADGTAVNPGETVVDISIIVKDEMSEGGLRTPDDGTEIWVWLRNIELNAISTTSPDVRAEGTEEYGPYTATTKDAQFTININNLKRVDGAVNAPEKLPEGNYSLLYQSTDGGWVGQGDISIKVVDSGKNNDEDNNNNEEDNSKSSSGGGCNVGYGLFGFLLAVIVMKKRSA
jgi:hypothetical protein